MFHTKRWRGGRGKTRRDRLEDPLLGSLPNFQTDVDLFVEITSLPKTAVNPPGWIKTFLSLFFLIDFCRRPHLSWFFSNSDRKEIVGFKDVFGGRRVVVIFY